MKDLKYKNDISKLGYIIISIVIAVMIIGLVSAIAIVLKETETVEATLIEKSITEDGLVLLFEKDDKIARFIPLNYAMYKDLEIGKTYLFTHQKYYYHMRQNVRILEIEEVFD